MVHSVDRHETECVKSYTSMFKIKIYDILKFHFDVKRLFDVITPNLIHDYLASLHGVTYFTKSRLVVTSGRFKLGL